MADRPLLVKGSTSREDNAYLQDALAKAGLMSLKAEERGFMDGDKTIDSVKNLQDKLKITADGKVGHATWFAVDKIHAHTGAFDNDFYTKLAADTQAYAGSSIKQGAQDLLKTSVTDANLSLGKGALAGVGKELGAALENNQLAAKGNIDLAGMNLAAQEKLAAVSADYYKAAHKPVVATSGHRGADRQAGAMYDNKVGHHEPSYKNKGLWAQVTDTYNKFFHKGRAETVAAMTETLEHQMEHGQYISKHMTGDCADVSFSGLDIKAMQEALKKNNVHASREEGANHWHLDFSKPYIEQSADKHTAQQTHHHHKGGGRMS